MFVSRCSLAINASEIIKLLVDPRLHVRDKFLLPKITTDLRGYPLQFIPFVKSKRD